MRTPDIGTGPTLIHDDVTLNVTTAAKAAFSNEVIVAGKTWAGTQTLQGKILPTTALQKHLSLPLGLLHSHHLQEEFP